MRATRTRGLALAAAAAVAVTLLAAVPAPADPISCGVAQGFRWCDDHWPWADLPVEVYVNISTLAPGVSAADFGQAVQGAVEAWEIPAKLFPMSPPDDGCPSGTRVFCYKGTTTTGVAVDGKTIVRFGAVSGGAIAETRTCFVGSGCPSTGTQIKDVDVTLRASGTPWHQANTAEDLMGEIGGPFGPYRCFASPLMCPNWYDVQSIITHELGHVLGLDEAEGLFDGCGTSGGEWASDPSDAWNFMQTMYPCQWKGLTNRRTIDSGDFAGLTTVFLGSRLDS